MLKAVIDTNQFVSSLINKKGPPAQLIEAWRNHYYVLITAKDILAEIRRVLSYPHISQKYCISQDDIESLMSLIEHEGIVLSETIKLDVVKEDPEDNKILACAIGAKADYIVSGDKHLRDLRQYQGIPIITVVEFLKLLNIKKRNSY